MIEKKPFVKYGEEEAVNKPLPVKLNEIERELLAEGMARLHQPKQSTAIKSLAWLGLEVLRRPEVGQLIELLFKNKRNNRRSGNEMF